MRGQHFSDLEAEGGERTDSHLTALVRGDFCSALAAALSVGFKVSEGFSLKTRHLWDLFDSATRAPGMCSWAGREGRQGC
jgi:hypothetical protein